MDTLLATPINTATKYEQKMMQAPASVTIITSEDIDRYGYITLGEALDSLRGVYSSYDRNYTYVGLRGFGRPTDYNNRFLILIDGHPINENIWGSAAVGKDFVVDMSSVERIEFVRGPGSAVYGTGAMLGVVNVIMKRPEDREGMTAGISAGSQRSVGWNMRSAWMTESGTSVAISALGDSRRGDSIYYPEFDDASTNFGWAEGRDDEHRYGLTGSVARGGLTLSGYSASRTKGIPTGAYGATFNTDAHTVDRQDFIEARYARRLRGGSQFDVSVSWDRYRYRGGYPDDGWTDSSTGSWLASEARLSWNYGANQRLTSGLRYVHNLRSDYSTSDGGSLSGGAADVASLYVEDEYQPRENLTFVGGLRYDTNSQNSGLTPRLAVIFNPSTQSAVKLLWGSSFRDPNVYERLYGQIYDPNASTSRLDAERIQTIEAVWEQRITTTVLSVFSVYQFRVQNLIEQAPAVDDLGISRYFNRSSATNARGLEWEIDHRAKSGIWSYFRYSTQLAQEEGEGLTNSPRHLLKAGASLSPHQRLRAGGEIAYDSGRKTLRGGETDPFLIANANVAVSLPRQISLRLTARNLFGSRYGTPGGFEHAQDTIIQDGRTLLLEVSFRKGR